MRLTKQKKGVSPLIATVLLIAFAVALGALVMEWGKSYTTNLQDSASKDSSESFVCNSEIYPSIVTVDKINQICLNTSDPSTGKNTVYAIIENSPIRKIDRFDVMIIGTTSKVPLKFELGNESALTPTGTKMFNVTYDDSYGDVSQIRFSPVVMVGDENIVCKVNNIKVTELLSCDSIWN